jgi:RNA polymerase sigma factor (sigma-70 family)
MNKGSVIWFGENVWSILKKASSVPSPLRTQPFLEEFCAMHPRKRSALFEQLALPLLPSLYSHAFWLCRNHAEAEDIVQETLSKALRAFDSFEPGSNFKAWSFRILRNTFLTSRTAIATSHTVFLEDQAELHDLSDASPGPEEILLRLDNEAALTEALEHLHPQLREVLLLCEVEELKYKEIAMVLDIPIGTVMSRISRARRTLQELLRRQFGEAL